MKQWQKIGIAVGALVLAIAAGTGAYAMRGGDDDRGENTARQSQDEAGDDKRAADPSDVIGGADGGLASICIEGTVDCQDTDLGDPIAQPCPEDGCTAESYDCPPDQSCIEPWLMDPPVCPEGVDPEVCFPDGQTYECVTLESDPPQTRCYGVTCGAPVETLPADVEDVPLDVVTDPAPDGISAEEAEKLREQAAREGEEIVPCDPITPAEDCGSGAVAGTRCLPPDCSVSSGGVIACPDELVDPPADGQGQTEPGSAGTGGGVDGSPPVQVDRVE